MIKKYFLPFLAMLLLNLGAFAQTQISTADDFLSALSNNPAGNYIQTANIDLGVIDLGQNGYISNFSGTYDGDGHSITFTATATATADNARIGLFGTVTGTIKNLNLNNCQITAETDGSNTAEIALLCARLDGNNALVTDCNITNGNINSTIVSGEAFEREATGLLIGHLRNGASIKYSNVNGNVTGIGYVGGLVGQATSGNIYGCSFIGSVTARYESSWQGGFGQLLGTGAGAYAGGILGYGDSSTKIDLCYVKGDIISDTEASGIGSAKRGGWLSGATTPQVTNCYAEGTVTENGNTSDIDNDSDITNSSNKDDIYHPGSGSAEDIVTNLNNAVPDEDSDKITFSVVNGEVVFGAVNDEKVCEKPTNLLVTNNNGTCVITWDIEGADDTVEEGNWHWTITGGDSYTASGDVTTRRVETSLPPSQTPYTFTVYSDCTADQADLVSDNAQIPIQVACPIPSNLQATNITYESFDFSWDATADCQLKVNGNTYTISQSNPMTKTITGLAPQTSYPVRVIAKCGNEYVEEVTSTVTTASLPIPTDLAVNSVWNGTSGTATITWTSLPGMTYEVNTEGNEQTSPYQITDLASGPHTAKVRTVKTIAGTKYYSDWATMSYTVSEIPAPSNPQVTYTQDGNTCDVTISWTAGSVSNDGWEIEGVGVTNPYILQNQTPGFETTLAIKERVGGSTSEALEVSIEVPCLPVGVVNVEPTQSTAKFIFANPHPNRKLYIGETEYDAMEETLNVLVGLQNGKTYSYEVREYCLNDNYSSVTGTFNTAGCFVVKNISVSNLGVTTATVSWESQNTLEGLNYRISLNGGTPIIQTATTVDFTGLTPATAYTVVVEEQCGDGWATATTVEFTTESGSYVTATSGQFNQSSTWQGGKVPAGNVGTITIRQGHTVTLSNTLRLTGSCQIVNQGVLVITQQGELINKTANEVGGIVEVVSPNKEMNKWTFIGAPFETGYKLECIKPTRSGEDIIDVSVSKYNYDYGRWSNAQDGENEWATIETSMETGEGCFAWPFYSGTIIYTTYGDLLTNQYDFAKPPVTKLNNLDEVTITKTVPNTSGGYWMALSNPYPAKLDIADFIQNNQSKIQGGSVYKFNGTTWDDVSSGNINHTEGFFVNLKSTASPQAVTFRKDQLTNYSQSKKAKTTTEYLELSLQVGRKKSKIRFNHNELAEQSYDEFDANKMFSPVKMTELYFVTDGIALSKEEVKELPYTATLNVRSYIDMEVKFVADNIPEGYVVTLVDNEQSIRMSNGTEYTTNVVEGENEDRFKLLVKKQTRLENAVTREITIKNYNREITIQSQMPDLTIEVYDALGRKVLETKERNFTLEDVTSGVYMIKAFNQRVSETTKIVIE